MVVQLRYYQEEALQATWERHKAGKKGAVIDLPTGSGKTIVTAKIAEYMVKEHNGMLLVLAEREMLLEQARNKILDVYPGADIGIYGFGKRYLDHKIVLGGVDTLSRPEHLEKIKEISFTCINIDEFHHIAAPKYRKILKLFPNAFLIGQSATTFRHDGKDIFGIVGCDNPTYKKSILELIEQIDPATGHSYLSSLRCEMIKTRISLGEVKMKGDDYDEDSLAQAIDRPDRNFIIVNECKKEEYGGPHIPTVVFAANKNHARALEAEFNRQGIPAKAVIDGTQDEDTATFEAFAKWEIPVLITVTKLCEGWDADVRRIVIAAGTKSNSRYLQRLGRGTRTAPGKLFCWVLDFTDDSDIHSLEPLTLASVLGLPELETGGDVLEAIKNRREKGEHLPGEEYGDDDQQTFMGGELVYQEKELHKHIDWSSVRGGNYLTCIGDDRIILSPTTGGKYNVVVDFWDAQTKQPRMFVQDSNKPLSWAQSLAEGYAQTIKKGHKHMLDPEDARTRGPASPEQLARLKQMKVHVPPGCTKGEASKLMNDAIARFKQKASKKRAERSVT